MRLNDLDVVFTVLTLLLFMTYEIRKFIKGISKRPTFCLIDEIYDNIYDLFFGEIKSYKESVKLNQIYDVMGKMFTDASIEEKQINEYITYLNKKSGKILYLPIITAITSFFGITNWESIKEVKISISNINYQELFGNKILWILIVLLIFMIILFYKTFSGDKLHKHIRESQKPVILTDYLSFTNSNSPELKLEKLQYAKNVLDFLGKNVSLENKKLKVKQDKKIKVYKNNMEIEDNQEIPYSDECLTVQYEDKQTSQKENYSFKIQMTEDNRYTKIIADSTTTQKEFSILCSIRNDKKDVLENQLYNLFLLGFFYKKIDQAIDKKSKFGWHCLLTLVILIVYILMVVILELGSVLLPIVFVIYFLSDFLISKIFE